MQWLRKIRRKNVKMILMHPPYLDIIQFTENPNDLSHISNLTQFVRAFVGVCKKSLPFLEKNKYFALIVGDVFKNGEVISFLFI